MKYNHLGSGSFHIKIYSLSYYAKHSCSPNENISLCALTTQTRKKSTGNLGNYYLTICCLPLSSSQYYPFSSNILCSRCSLKSLESLRLYIPGVRDSLFMKIAQEEKAVNYNQHLYQPNGLVYYLKQKKIFHSELKFKMTLCIFQKCLQLR